MLPPPHHKPNDAMTNDAKQMTNDQYPWNVETF
jgi:hypothetical protein